MPRETPSSDRIFVAIAVSRPEKLPELPGAITAARRMTTWAGENNYRSICIDDADGEPVTASRIRDAVVSAIESVQEERPVGRLILFFAGHGGLKDINETFWLLTHWWTRPEEAVHLTSLRRMLQFYGPQQVSLIGDACQAVHKDFIDVNGSSILFRRDEDPSVFELDQFFAADVGERAFMIPGDNDNAPFCIFTEVLLDALQGDAEDAYEPGEDGESLVTSGSLTTYLNRELPRAAGRYDLTMRPQPQPGFYTDRTYARFSRTSATGPRNRLGPEPDDEVSRERINRERAQREIEEARRDGIQRQVRAELLASEAEPWIPGQAQLVTIGTEAQSVQVSRGRAARISSRGWAIEFEDESDWSVDAIVQLRDRFVYACIPNSFTTSVYSVEDDIVGVMQRAGGRDPRSHEFVIDLLGKLEAGLLNRSEMVNIAAHLRQRKHQDVTLGCLAAYFYASFGDVDSVRSIASYYIGAEQPIPMDVALLAEGVMSQTYRGELVIDIPAVPERAPRTLVEESLRFTYSDQPAVEGGPILGRAPWFRSGWRLLDSSVVDSTATGWREAALSVSKLLLPGHFASVDAVGLPALSSLLQTEMMMAGDEMFV